MLTLALALPWAAAAAAAAQPPAAADGAERPVVIQGPPPPEPPAVFTRDAAGRMTIRAIRLTEPLDIDGTLDEPFYRDVPGLTDFVQVEPIEGAPATEQTEVWLAFDDDNVYISARCWDSAPESRWIANELRRDSFNIGQNEYIDIVLDTFYDRRNGINLTVNPLGGRMDGQITDERDYSADWNPIWSVRAGRFAGGWTFESAIPFKSLRYRPGRTQVWGFSLTRKVRWKNELSSLVPLPISRGIMLISQAATVVGIEAPDDGGRVLEITPRLSLEPSVSFNWLDLPQGRFSTELVTTRTTYALSPLMFVSALLQYNSSNASLGANVRLRWEYQPGSELFVVYNEARDTLRPGRPELRDRALIIKINWLFRL